jgi:hypothetical protein
MSEAQFKTDLALQLIIEHLQELKTNMSRSKDKIENSISDIHASQDKTSSGQIKM